MKHLKSFRVPPLLQPAHQVHCTTARLGGAPGKQEGGKPSSTGQLVSSGVVRKKELGHPVAI